MKRTISLIILSVISTVVVAQTPREGKELAEYLQLTPAQQTAWQNAHSDFEATARPLFAKDHDLGEKLEAALKSESADACTVGAALLAHQAVGDQIRAAHEALDQKLASVLTAEQKVKFEAFKAAKAGGGERKMRRPF